MYTPNVERNRIIYDLWEKNLTVREISTSTGIARSTVGYYVRKFNRLAAEGKPVVFPGARSPPRKSSTSNLNSVDRLTLRIAIDNLLEQLDPVKLYYFLMDVKLLSEFGFAWKPDDFQKMSKSLG